MDNTNIKAPKLNISNIKSPLSGGGFSLGNVGQEGNSKTRTLARIVGKNRISINSLIKSQETQDRKITILKNIVQNIQKNVVKNIQNIQKNVVKNIQNIQKNVIKNIQNIQKNIVQNVQKNIVEDNQKNIVQNVQKNIVEDNQKNIVQKNIVQNNILQNVQKNIVEDNQKNIVQNNILQNVQKNIVQNNIVQNVQKNIVGNKIKINAIEKSQKIQDEKITILKNISQNTQSNIGQKLPDSGGSNIEKSLTETNKILVDIQNQLLFQSQQEKTQEKEDKRRESIAESKKKLKKEESALEKTAKGIGKAVGKVALKIVQPIGGIFDKILEFITLMGAGIAVNAAFEWFKDEENQKKITKFFNILKENWKLIRNIFGSIIAVGAILKVASAIVIIGKVLSLLASPVVLKLLAVAGTAAGIVAIANKIKDITAGGEEYRKLYEDNNEKLNEAGVAQPSSPTSKETMLLAPNPEGGYFQMVRQGVDQRTGQFGNLTTGSINPDTGKLYATPAQLNAFDAWKSEKLKIDNLDKKSGELPEPKAMGGPVMAGNTYLVGERGPEIFSPNINGSIVNNMRTEKIVQTLSSDMGEGSINMIELPPITNQLPPPEIPVPSGPATEVPEVSSVNLADPYRQLTPMLYGITV